jgi:outer membrane protein assembly factor BamB
MTLRLWPAAAIGLLVLTYGVPLIVPGAALFGYLGGVAVSLWIVAWWLFFSRAPWSERLGALAIMAVALAVTPRFLHVSTATAGQGMLFYIHALPLLSLAFVLWAVLARRLEGVARWTSMIATIALACGFWTLLRTGGVTGDGRSELAWRWSETSEERLLTEAPVEPMPAPQPPAAVEEAPPEPVEITEDLPDPAPAPVEAKPEAEWPGFRGPHRDGVVAGMRIETDWSRSPPVELWRRPVGPGWSSFAVDGDFLYTQEQRGDEELVACYHARTGEMVWAHADAARFYESNGGPGPRGTPTLRDGRVYTFGATGILNVLDAANGALYWSRDVSADAEKKIPIWGFSSSPLVLEDLVIVAAAGKLAAYDLATGEPRWFGPNGGAGYSSPHLATIDGVEQVLLLHGSGIASVARDDGTPLWEHDWPGDGIVQPAVAANGDVLLGTGSGMGAQAGVLRLAIARGASGWTAEERWTSIRLKPYFNDFVLHEGHAFGFDGSILACVDLETGERKWKGGRYGHGQLVVLPDQDLLLVLSEDGELALVRAVPDEFAELARIPAIEGKTWNHPVVVGDVLFVRNGREMAAFRLALPST